MVKEETGISIGKVRMDIKHSPSVWWGQLYVSTSQHNPCRKGVGCLGYQLFP